MATVAVLGMGLLGVGFAQKLIENGHRVRVYNRTASKCDPVVAMGGTAAATPAEAVQGAERVHLVLAEDWVVDTVIEAFVDALGQGVPVIDHSTNAPAKVGERVQRLAGRGVRYLHAPVFMSPQNSREATGAMLVSGERGLVDALQGDLEPMTGRVMNLGTDPTRAATVKLTGNAMLAVITAGMADVMAIGENNGMTAEQTLELFRAFSPTALGMGQRILRDGPPSFQLTMARKDVRLMIEAAEGRSLSALPGIAEAMDRAIAEGRGELDFAAAMHRD